MSSASSLIGGTDRDRDLRSDIRVTGLERGSAAMVEVWIRAAEDVSQGSDSLVSRVVGVTTPAGATADLTAGSARILRASRPARTEVQVDLSAAGGSSTARGSLTAGGPITYTLVLRNSAAAEVANEAVARFDPDPAVTVESFEIHDTTGRASTCQRDGGSVTCTAPYLLPGETVTVTFDGQIAANASTASTGAGSKCAAQGQDLCAHASVLSVAGVSGPLTSADLATDVPAAQALGFTKRVGDGTAPLYAGRYVEFTYTVVPSSSIAVHTVVVNDPACKTVAMVGGDTSADNWLNPGEQWVFHCSAVVDASQQGRGDRDGQESDQRRPRRLSAGWSTPVLSPALAVLRPGTTAEAARRSSWSTSETPRSDRRGRGPRLRRRVGPRRHRSQRQPRPGRALDDGLPAAHRTGAGLRHRPGGRRGDGGDRRLTVWAAAPAHARLEAGRDTVQHGHGADADEQHRAEAARGRRPRPGSRSPAGISAKPTTAAATWYPMARGARPCPTRRGVNDTSVG